MTDKVGVLASATDATTGTHTIGTVPTGKAWVFKPMFLVQAGGGGATVLKMTVNGCDIMQGQSYAASAYGWSSSAILSNESATAPDGGSVANTVAPGPATYYASAGQTVTYNLATTAATAANIQLVGTEVDA